MGHITFRSVISMSVPCYLIDIFVVCSSHFLLQYHAVNGPMQTVIVS